MWYKEVEGRRIFGICMHTLRILFPHSIVRAPLKEVSIYPRNAIIENFTNFSKADDDFDPICLQGKYWEFIKDDIEQMIASWQQSNLE